MPKRIYLIRHGEIAGNGSGCFLGSADLPLSARGMSQVERLAALLPAKLLEHGAETYCVASPLQRARQTADAVAGRRGLTVAIDTDLRETDFGAWERLTFEEIEAQFPGQLATWASPTDDMAFPGGERLGDFAARTSRALDRILAVASPHVLVFAHGGVIRSMACALLHLGRSHFWMLDVQPASVVHIDVWEEGAVIAGLRAVPDEEET